jgi:hypothetical protein
MCLLWISSSTWSIRRIGEILGGMPEIDHLESGAPGEELRIALGPAGRLAVADLRMGRSDTLDFPFQEAQECRLGVLRGSAR